VHKLKAIIDPKHEISYDGIRDAALVEVIKVGISSLYDWHLHTHIYLISLMDLGTCYSHVCTEIQRRDLR
jgi:hypothetical protein